MLVGPLVFRAPEGPAAREARRPHCVRRRASKPARALRSLRRPPHRRRLLGASARCLARLRRHPPALRPGPAASPLVSCPSLACRIVESTPNFARNSPKAVSNHELRSLELQRFQTLLKLRAIKLRAELRCEVSLPWLSLLLRGIALHRRALHCLVASALLLYLVHWFCI